MTPAAVARMDDAQVSPPMTWAEICACYPDEWVVLVDTDWVDDHNFDFRSARVVGHAPARKVALAAADPITSQAQRFGCFFTGPVRAPIVPLRWL